MIQVSDLWKAYGRHTVLSGLSFEVPAGSVTGFLGVNGAGKTTAMRVLTAFHPPQSGSVTVDGLDVVREARAVCRRVGYLPESMPVYPELRADEYLRFRARLRGLPAARVRRRVDEVIDECGLTTERRTLLGALSRGYRQRLGLADALLHDPPVLILDEPTAGLDPRQAVEVRQRIAALRGHRTVLLSSHLLSEVQEICDRVVILHEGRIQAQESRASWEDHLRRSGRLRVVVEDPPRDVRTRLAALPGVHEVQHDGGALLLSAHQDVRRPVFELAREAGWVLLELTPQPARLEDLFLALTAGAGKGGP